MEFETGDKVIAELSHLWNHETVIVDGKIHAGTKNSFYILHGDRSCPGDRPPGNIFNKPELFEDLFYGWFVEYSDFAEKTVSEDEVLKGIPGSTLAGYRVYFLKSDDCRWIAIKSSNEESKFFKYNICLTK